MIGRIDDLPEKEHAATSTDFESHIDVYRYLSAMPNQRYRNVLEALYIEDMNPEVLAKLGINGIDTNFWKFYSDPTWYTLARRNGMSVNVWTVDDKEHMRTMIELGVDYITTNYPELCRELLQEMGVKELKAGKNFK